ncbi:MAG: zinc-ribbon domain-containing protein [Candidatus Heimdallarchaeota archaeon]
MIFCSACGAQNEDGSVFCSNCGTKLEVSQQQPTQQKSDPYQSTQFQSSPQKNQYVDDQSYGYDKNLYQNNPTQYDTQQNYGQRPVAYGKSRYGQPYDQFTYEDRVHPGLYILAFIFFPIGLILYFSNKRQKPKSARNLLILSIIGIFLWI